MEAFFFAMFLKRKSSTNPEKDAALRDVLPLFHTKSIQLPFRFLTDQEVLQIAGLSNNFACIKRALVMSPIDKPLVDQPGIGNILPVYLTKEGTDKDNKRELDKRLRILGSLPLRHFLVDNNLATYINDTAVPQWLFFDKDVNARLVSHS